VNELTPGQGQAGTARSEGAHCQPTWVPFTNRGRRSHLQVTLRDCLNVSLSQPSSRVSARKGVVGRWGETMRQSRNVMNCLCLRLASRVCAMAIAGRGHQAITARRERARRDQILR
jgi:hypothetical protein